MHSVSTAYVYYLVAIFLFLLSTLSLNVLFSAWPFYCFENISILLYPIYIYIGTINCFHLRRVYAGNVVNLIRLYYVLCLILFCFIVDLFMTSITHPTNIYIYILLPTGAHVFSYPVCSLNVQFFFCPLTLHNNLIIAILCLFCNLYKSSYICDSLFISI